MNLIVDFKKNGNYNTELYNLLANIPNNFIFYNGEHRLATPLSIYDKSIKRLLKAFEDMIENLNMYYNINISDSSWNIVNASHKELLDSIMSFIDDGYHIMKCFYSKSCVTKNIIFADKWLCEVDNVLIKNYKKNIEPYRKKIAAIDNKIKHSHARYYQLECCHYYSPNISSRAVGYYIGGIDEKGKSLPDEDIHPLYNGMCTAISYNKDIPELLANVYYIAYYITNTINNIISKNNKISINIEKKESSLDSRIISIFEKVNSIKKLFFPDEYNEKLTEFIIQDNSITIKRPVSKKYLKKLYRTTNLTISHTSIIEYGKSMCLLYKK